MAHEPLEIFIKSKTGKMFRKRAGCSEVSEAGWSSGEQF